MGNVRRDSEHKYCLIGEVSNHKTPNINCDKRLLDAAIICTTRNLHVVIAQHCTEL